MAVSGVSSNTDTLASCDPVWQQLREEADDIARREPDLASVMHASILSKSSLEDVVIHQVAKRLADVHIGEERLIAAFKDVVKQNCEYSQLVRVDLAAVLERDPACERYIEPILYFKGFHAIQSHRFANALWRAGRQDFALHLQSRSSSVFQTDIHPQVPFGKGIFFDHATGLVIGMTAEIGDDVSILQGVTLGGTGKEDGDRHPKIRRGVLIGAGANVLGNIEIGECAKVASGSVVLKPVPACCTVAGVPARVVGRNEDCEPSRTMDQMLSENQD